MKHRHHSCGCVEQPLDPPGPPVLDEVIKHDQSDYDAHQLHMGTVIAKPVEPDYVAFEARRL